MKSDNRQVFNKSWSTDKYEALYNNIEVVTGHRVPFRIAETPVFLDIKIWDKLVEATEDLINQIVKPNFLESTGSVFELTDKKVPKVNDRPHFIQFDFGITEDENGIINPKLIELQGFPSLYFFQPMLAAQYEAILPHELLGKFKFLADGLDYAQYKKILSGIILGQHKPEEVIVLEVDPFNQPTYIDFGYTALELGIKVVCLSDVIMKDNRLYYMDNENEIQIKRIYNRVIFDELINRREFINEYDLSQDVEVEWAGHPDWYFRLSKYTMPRLTGDSVPKTYFLNEVDFDSLDLSKFVLKPLFSFAGGGVEIDITIDMLTKVDHPQNYILQEKVAYADLVKDPDGGISKFEVRMMVVWPDEAPKPFLVGNLVRLSKGKMVGVKYNKDKTWVGGSVAFREK